MQHMNEDHPRPLRKRHLFLFQCARQTAVAPDHAKNLAVLYGLQDRTAFVWEAGIFIGQIIGGLGAS